MLKKIAVVFCKVAAGVLLAALLSFALIAIGIEI